MKLPLFHIDAFSAKVFAGNPAAVCPLDAWLPDALMQSIASENNLSETAFFVKGPEGYRIRWFTPVSEVDLCGHATLAAAHVLFEHLGHPEAVITFSSRSGPLHVSKTGKMLQLDFPAEPPVACPVPSDINEAFSLNPVEVLRGSDYIVVFDDQTDLKGIQPNIEALRKLDLRGVCITAAGKSCDFVSRFFAPNFGIDEDPVTGSAHTQLAPYWAARLGKSTIKARQLSARGGDLECTLDRNRVLISGQAVTYLKGTIHF